MKRLAAILAVFAAFAAQDASATDWFWFGRGADTLWTTKSVQGLTCYDILFGMRRCRISLPNRCYHLISRVAHRVLEWGKRRIERVAPL